MGQGDVDADHAGFVTDQADFVGCVQKKLLKRLVFCSLLYAPQTFSSVWDIFFTVLLEW